MQQINIVEQTRTEDIKQTLGSLRTQKDLIIIFEVPSSSKMRIWILAEDAAEAAAAAAASFALLDERPLRTMGILGTNADSNRENLSRQESQAKSLALPESTMD